MQHNHISTATDTGIDESLYSRQLYVLGFEAMRRMLNSNVLIINVRGLGVEVAKNVALAGVRSLTLWDQSPTASTDLAAQFFLTEADIGRPRAAACASRISELNEYVPVKVLDVPADQLFTAVTFAAYQVIVLLDGDKEQKLKASRLARQAQAAFIAANVRGLFGAVFCDFGPSFVVSDVTGEPPLSGLVSMITEDGTVTCGDETRHGLEDGDVVVFRELKGATLDGQYKVQVLSPYSFKIIDVNNIDVRSYQAGSGAFDQVKQPKMVEFKSFEELIEIPADQVDYVVSDFAKMERQSLLHCLFNQLPVPEDGDKMVIDEFNRQASGYLAPMCSAIGGIVAQEVIKACTGKFHPIKQFLYFDALECLGGKTPVDCQPIGSRYDSQICVFGQAFQRRLAEMRGFVVGAGAIGCELLKVAALMGVGCGEQSDKRKRGLLTVTDMDNIEKSNLNRQFLFRPKDIGRSKATCAAEACTGYINPRANIEARVDRVGPETEHIFNDEFFESLDFVANALDNVEARRYMDRRCVYFRKPLLESGTLGTKGNTQVVVPYLTESYSSSADPPERSIPFCTLHNFPNTIEHTIQWAMDQFHGFFRSEAETGNKYLGDKSAFIDSLESNSNGRELAKVALRSLSNVPESLSDCIRWGRLVFEQLFVNNAKQLLFNFPLDSVTTQGTPFWSGPKRPPHPLVFDDRDHFHMDFVRYAARLRAQVYGVSCDGEISYNQIREALQNFAVPVFVPQTGVKIKVNENDQDDASSSASGTFDSLWFLFLIFTHHNFF